MKKKPVEKDNDRQAMEWALFLLKFRSRSRSELEKRLSQKGFLSNIVNQTLSRLEELGLINDLQLARHCVEMGQNAGQGEFRIKQTLWKRGIPREMIEEVAGSLREEDESIRAWNTLKKRAARMKETDHQKLYRRLGGYLSRQGFSPDHVADALTKFFSSEDKEEGVTN